jgi:hypothetical protein
VASTKGAGRTARKKYVPSAGQRTEDERLRKEFENLTAADIKRFEETLEKAVRQKTIRSRCGYSCLVLDPD